MTASEILPDFLAGPEMLHADNEIRVWHAGLVQGDSRIFFSLVIEAVTPRKDSFPLPVELVLQLQRAVTVTFTRDDGVTLPHPMISGAEDLAAMTWVAAFDRLPPGNYLMHVDIPPLNVHHATKIAVAS